MSLSCRYTDALQCETQHLNIGAAALIPVLYFHPQQFQKPGDSSFGFRRAALFLRMNAVPERHEQHDQDQGYEQRQDHKQYYADYLQYCQKYMQHGCSQSVFLREPRTDIRILPVTVHILHQLFQQAERLCLSLCESHDQKTMLPDIIM